MYNLQYITGVRKNSAQNLEGLKSKNVTQLLEEATELLNSIKQLNGISNDYDLTRLQYNDLLYKYHTDEGSEQSGAYKLPGINNVSPTFDPTTMQQDSAKVNELKDMNQELEHHQELYFNLALKRINRIFALMKEFHQIEQNFNLLMVDLNPLV